MIAVKVQQYSFDILSPFRGYSAARPSSRENAAGVASQARSALSKRESAPQRRAIRSDLARSRTRPRPHILRGPHAFSAVTRVNLYHSRHDYYFIALLFP